MTNLLCKSSRGDRVQPWIRARARRFDPVLSELDDGTDMSFTKLAIIFTGGVAKSKVQITSIPGDSELLACTAISALSGIPKFNS